MISISLIGPPGSGKSTIANYLADEFLLVNISIGKLIRQKILSNTELGYLIKEKTCAGNFLNDQLLKNLILEYISKIQLDGFNGFIFDGFPGTIDQVKLFNDLVLDLNVDSKLAIFLNLDLSTSLLRAKFRIECYNCGHIYSKKNNIKKCEYCNNQLIIRSDDSEMIIKKRYSNSLLNLEKLLKNNVFDDSIKLNANISLEKISSTCKEFIKSNI